MPSHSTPQSGSSSVDESDSIWSMHEAEARATELRQRREARERLFAALPDSPPGTHFGAVERARQVIMAIADAAWTVSQYSGSGPAAEAATRLIDAAMPAVSRREADSEAVAAVIQAVASGAKMLSDPSMPEGFIDVDFALGDVRHLWPEYYARIDKGTFVRAAEAWAQAGQGTGARHWPSVSDAIASAGLGRRPASSLKRQWRRWNRAGRGEDS